MKQMKFHGLSIPAMLVCLMMLLTACSSVDPEQINSQQSAKGVKLISTQDADKMRDARGQTLYVPGYSNIYYSDNSIFQLTTTLSIHNIDPEQPIVVRTVKYYNSDGDLVRNYLDQPAVLKPLATLHYVVDHRDTSGGIGANFMVDWFAETNVPVPAVEAVMIGASNNQGISFLTNARVIKEH